MSEKKAKMFNKKASKPKNKANEIIEKLALKAGQFIADIGSGGGYFTYRFAKAVGKKGKVYAVDTNQEFLAFIKKQATEQEFTNIITILTVSEYPDLPKHMFDYLFFRNVIHHLQNRINYFKSLSSTLKPNGKIVIIEYDGKAGFFSFQRFYRHFIPKDILFEEIKHTGYKLQKSYDFLSEQSFSIFSLN